MQYFRVTVNGKSYEVSVEEMPVSGGAPAQTAAAQPMAPSAPVTAATPAAAPTAPAEVGPVAREIGAGEESVPAPLGGTIMEIKVKPGDAVKKGQVLLTLEALKMENEIVAPADGTVGQIFVQAKDSVNSGDALLTLRL